MTRYDIAKGGLLLVMEFCICCGSAALGALTSSWGAAWLAFSVSNLIFAIISYTMVAGWQAAKEKREFEERREKAREEVAKLREEVTLAKERKNVLVLETRQAQQQAKQDEDLLRLRNLTEWRKQYEQAR